MLRPSHLLTALIVFFITTSLQAQIAWERASDGIDAVGVRSFIVTKAGTILGGTAGGIIRSTDGGASWTRVSAAARALFALDSNDRVHAASVDGIYSSVDDGRSWDRAFDWTGISPDGIVGGWKFQSTPGGTLYLTSEYGLYRMRPGFQPGYVKTLSLPQLTTSLIVTSSGQLMLSTSNVINRSTDDGKTWTSTPLAGNPAGLTLAPDGSLLAAIPTSMSSIRSGVWSPPLSMVLSPPATTYCRSISPHPHPVRHAVSIFAA